MGTNDASELARLRRFAVRFWTNLRVVIISTLTFIVGGAIVWLASDLKTTVVAVGSGLIAVATLAIASEVGLRRRLAAEVLESVGLRDEIAKAKVIQVLPGTSEFQQGFKAALKDAKYLDIMFLSATAWLEGHREAIEALLKAGGRVRVLIPSSKDTDLLTHLLTRFNYDSVADLASDVKLTYMRANEFRAVFGAKLKGVSAPTTDAAEEQPTQRKTYSDVVSGVSIRQLRIVPTYSFYRIDKMGVMRVHEVRKERARQTPVLVFGQGGSLWKFASTDFDTLFDAATEMTE